MAAGSGMSRLKDIESGHQCWPPVAVGTGSTNVSGCGGLFPHTCTLVLSPTLIAAILFTNTFVDPVTTATGGQH